MAHSDIRTYTFAEASDHPDGFLLRTLEDVYNGPTLESERPHRHDYYAIMFIEKGNGIHYVDFHEYPVSDGLVFFLMPGQMHQLLFFAQPKGHLIAFTEEFLIINAISQKMIDDLYLFNEYGISPPLALNDSQLPAYQNVFDQMKYFSESIGRFNREAIASLVQLFLVLSNNHCSIVKDDNPQLLESGNSLLRSFRNLLNKRYASNHQVSDYADELAVTADYLNKIVKSLTGVSAKEHIQNKLVLEAKRALVFTDTSNKELAFTLGFEEAAHFNNFFKKMTGMSPGEFRLGTRSNR
ncbi:MAG TPA: helix-turn-helix transcriptional regulator [Bacteroidales bacterium]|nr:helix-turn-helix transcriptional regulator [Bacteroidales bacterium]